MLLKALRSSSTALAVGFAGAAGIAYASSKQTEAESKKVKLTYFDIGGRAVSWLCTLWIIN